MGTVIGTVAVLVLFALTLAVALRHRPDLAPAPRLSPDLAETILLRAGFPATAHNVLAVREHLGTLFLEQGRRDVDPARWAEVEAACEAGRPDVHGDMGAWPQHVLDQIAAAGRGPDGAGGGAAAARLARRCQDALLASVGTGRGVFGGSLFEPLPRPGAAAV
ncbi:hypothetical protein Acsp06_30480 [Actinomycetospora sp. NBRC 106375]|uniref:hypothetical protein n=1 Tax=Actinomycetospora sp. NBRC 106375 TaxID=3032207 RepID=UPI0024A2EF40|nr:hypothetical protein [Actinomycetospora sp. NBRC 106375]GLZ46863.1 hypothetical protein Acsp06_30480 [Actinomycetospora sp. NBRC 106375]